MKDDEQLVAVARAGGPEAFGPIVERYQDAVFGVALARLRDFHEAEDVAQQVFIEAFERLDGLKDPARLGAWLRSVTIHRAIDRVRRRRDMAPVEDEPASARDELTPHGQMERRELRDQVLGAIARLSKTQRETTTLFYINGYSVQDVATIQEVPVGTVKGRLHDAREKLKEVMIGMVENVLKAEAPKPDFAQRVFGLVCRYQQPEPPMPWREMREELRRIGVDGVDGFIKAMRSPHSRTRGFTVGKLGDVHAVAPPAAGKVRDVLVGLLTDGVTDRSKAVRGSAANALLNLDVEVERTVREFLPLVLPLLADRSWRVRWRVAYELTVKWTEHVPLNVAAKALAVERHPRVRHQMERLVLAILEAREESRA